MASYYPGYTQMLSKKAMGAKSPISLYDYINSQNEADADYARTYGRQARNDQRNYETSLAALDAQRKANDDAIQSGYVNMATNLGSTAATAYGLSDSKIVGNMAKSAGSKVLNKVAPSVADYLGVREAAQGVPEYLAPAEPVNTVSNTMQNIIPETPADYVTMPSAQPAPAATGVAAETIGGKIGTAIGTKAGTAIAPYVASAAGKLGAETAGKSVAGWLSGEAAKTGAGYTGSFGSLGSTLGGVGGALSTAAPYYALAKAGGMVGNAVLENNPKLRKTPFGFIARSLSNDPLTVEDSLASELADQYGVGNEEWNTYAMSTGNPLEVGSWFTNTTEKAKNMLSPEMGLANALEKQNIGNERLNKYILATGNPFEFGSVLSHPKEKIGNMLTGGTYTPLRELRESSDAGRVATGVLTGGLSELVGGCIIITACTDSHSPEVETAREYRDKFLDAESLRGYYKLAERIVPRIESNGKIKQFIKKHLVDSLVEYGSSKLGKTDTKPCMKSRIISKCFLGLIKAIGASCKSYVRCNGEVY